MKIRMADIELVIKIPEGLKNDFEAEQWTALSCMEMKNALEKATQLPKGHGRLIDADAFITTMEDVSKRQKYKELLTDDLLTVDDVFKAIIESLQNEGLAEGDSPTLIEADKAESEDKQ